MTIIPQIFQDYSDVGSIYYWNSLTFVGTINSWKRVYDPNVNIYYSHLSDRDGVMVLVVESLSYSDYSGSSRNVSNHRVFMDEFRDVPGVHEVCGAYGSCGVALEHKALKNEAIQEVLASLANYPVLSDDDLSQLEHDAYTAEWNDYGCHEFQRAIVSKFDANDEGLEDRLDEIDYDAFQSLYESLIPSGEYYISQCGDSVYLPIDRAVNALTYDALTAFLASV